MTLGGDATASLSNASLDGENVVGRISRHRGRQTGAATTVCSITKLRRCDMSRQRGFQAILYDVL